jgi:hypothetical protein
MNQSTSFARKVIYVACIGGLLIPLSLVGRPATRDKSNAIRDAGGVISQLRDVYELSPAKLSEIDPGSETMKLASLGLRGIAVNILWLKATEFKEQKDWDNFASTLNSLVKIQPNFVKVWEYQGHNLSYNVAVEFDDYEQRYHWIKKGITFLTQGIPFNRRDHRIIDNLGMICGQKFGIADERTQYRTLFRNDTAFHDEMSQFVNVDRINTAYGPDHWLLAYEWYGRSINLVENVTEGERIRKFSRDVLFYQKQPSQLRNMGLSLHDEFRADEFQQSNWRRAHEEWVAYGNRPLIADEDPSRTAISLDSMTQSLERLRELRAKLDELAPGIRKRLVSSRLEALPEQDRALLDRPVDSLDSEELEAFRRIDRMVNAEGQIDKQVLDDPEFPAANRRAANELLNEIGTEQVKLRLGDNQRDTINYTHWKNHTLVESRDDAIVARQFTFDAVEDKRRTLLDAYTVRDPVTGEKKTFDGSIQKFEKAFSVWAEILKSFSSLRTGALMDSILDDVREYSVIREAAGMDPWPDNFALQDIIDWRRENERDPDDLPTSEEIAALKNESRLGDPRLRLPKRPNIDFRLQEDEE